jgi:hypothetical protein
MRSAVKKVRNSRKKVERRLATQKARPAVGNVVNLMDALRASIGQEQASKPARKSKKATGQKEMLLPIDGKKPAKEAAPKKSVGRAQRKSAWVCQKAALLDRLRWLRLPNPSSPARLAAFQKVALCDDCLWHEAANPGCPLSGLYRG